MKKTTVRCHLQEKRETSFTAGDPRSRHRRNPLRCQELRSDRRIRTVS